METLFLKIEKYFKIKKLNRIHEVFLFFLRKFYHFRKVV